MDRELNSSMMRKVALARKHGVLLACMSMMVMLTYIMFLVFFSQATLILWVTFFPVCFFVSIWVTSAYGSGDLTAASMLRSHRTLLIVLWGGVAFVVLLFSYRDCYIGSVFRWTWLCTPAWYGLVLVPVFLFGMLSECRWERVSWMLV